MIFEYTSCHDCAWLDDCAEVDCMNLNCKHAFPDGQSGHIDRFVPKDCEERFAPKCEIKDSGNRREFETGAVRDIQEGKGRCDLMPLDVLAEVMGKFPFEWFAKFQETNDPKYLIALLQVTKDKLFEKCWSQMFLEVAKHFEEGAKKYGEYNWQKGIPAHCYIDSAVRHYLKLVRGDKDEPHDRAFVWNVLCCIWTVKHGKG